MANSAMDTEVNPRARTKLPLSGELSATRTATRAEPADKIAGQASSRRSSHRLFIT